MHAAEGTSHSQPAKRQGEWTPACRTQGCAYPVDFGGGLLVYSSSRWPLSACLRDSDLVTSSSSCGHSFYFPALGTPQTDPHILRRTYIHKSLVQASQLQGFQTTTTIPLSSQPVQINCCKLRAWVFVKFKQICRAQELCSIAFPWQPAPSSSPRQSDALMGLLAHQLRRCRSSRSLIQTRVLVLQLWNKEVFAYPKPGFNFISFP